MFRFSLFRLSPRLFLLLALLSSGGLAGASTIIDEPFAGIIHLKRTDWPNIPRPVEANILIVDLTHPDIRFRLTEPHQWYSADEAYTKAETTLNYLGRVNAQIAFNANFYEALSGGLTRLKFLAVSDGTKYSKIEGGEPALNIDPDNNARIVTRGAPAPTYVTSPTVVLHNAAGGNERIVFQGGNVANAGTGTGSYYGPRARTVAGLSQDNTTLIIITVDEGTDRSRGVTPPESADLLLEYGVWDGINLDGGGSTTLAFADPTPRLVNVPFDGGVAGGQRSVGSNMAIFASTAPDASIFSDVRVTTGLREGWISWKTQTATTAMVVYGTTPSSLDQQTFTRSEPSTSHVMLLPQLEPDTTYYYRLVATDGTGTFTTRLSSFTTGVSVVIDNRDLEAAFHGGTWSTGTSAGGWGPDYRFGGITGGSPTRTAIYRPDLPQPGDYDVQVFYLQGGNRSTAARHTITHRTGSNVTTVNQTINGSQWFTIGAGLPFGAGEEGHVTLDNHDPAGSSTTVVMADAMRWVLREEDVLPAGTVPAWWLEHFFGTTDIDASADHNGSGFSTAEEFVLGTSPSDRSLAFRMRYEQSSNGLHTVHFWPCYPGRTYRLEVSDDLTSGWMDLEKQGFTRQADGGGLLMAAGSDHPRRFFRIRVTR